MSATGSERLKAYKVYVWKIGKDPVCIVSAETRAKAIARSFKDAREAEFDLKWWDFRAFREPSFDQLAKLYGPFGWTPQHAQTMLENLKP